MIRFWIIDSALGSRNRNVFFWIYCAIIAPTPNKLYNQGTADGCLVFSRELVLILSFLLKLTSERHVVCRMRA